MKRYAFLGLIALLLSNCNLNKPTPEEVMQESARNFATAYFNFDFPKARKLSTPESDKWLRYAASNVTQADIDLFNQQEQTAEVSVEDFLWENDTTGLVTVIVSHFVHRDSIGTAPSIIDNEWFNLRIVNRNGQTLVKMEGPLRSEKQSHD